MKPSLRNPFDYKLNKVAKDLESLINQFVKEGYHISVFMDTKLGELKFDVVPVDNINDRLEFLIDLKSGAHITSGSGISTSEGLPLD